MTMTLGQENLIVSHPRLHPFYPTTSNFIVAAINHVHTYFGAKKAGYHFTAQQMSLSPQKQW